MLNQVLPQLLQQYGLFAFVGVLGVIFIETGLVFVPFLPGDSLLFLCGSLLALGQLKLPLPVCMATLAVAAIAGDGVNFWIGQRFGRYLTTHQRLRRWLKPAYLARATTFFERHGHSAIFLGRFMPIIRTFVPFTAGMSHMSYWRFTQANILGGLAWTVVGTGAGFLFGQLPLVRDHFELMMLAIVLLSLLPAGIALLRERRTNHVS